MPPRARERPAGHRESVARHRESRSWRPSRSQCSTVSIFGIRQFTRRTILELAEHAPHGVGDFAERRLLLDGGDDGRHQVVAAARGATRRRRVPHATPSRSGRRERRVRDRSAAVRPPGRRGRSRSAIAGVASAIPVDADDDCVARVDRPLRFDTPSPGSAAGCSRTRSPRAFRRSRRSAREARAPLPRYGWSSPRWRRRRRPDRQCCATPLSCRMICCVRSAIVAALFGWQRQRFVLAVAMQ